MPPQKTNFAIWLFFALIFIFLIGNFVFMEYGFNQLKATIAGLENPSPTPSVQNLESPAPLPAASAAPSVSPTVSPRPVQVYSNPSSQTKITYIPLSGGSTQNTDWVNIESSSFSLNISDYGSKAYVVWDANMHVDNASGTTFARLFDKTHGIAVNGSEISISNTSASTYVVSSGLSFWQGNNSYVIQLKSLNSSTAFIDSGRIKISY